MALAQPKIKSRVRCLGRTVGEVAHVIADPLSLEVSHIVVRSDGILLQVPINTIAAVKEDTVDLLCDSGRMADFPPFKREDFLASKEVEIPHLEERIRAEPGDVLVPFPELERSLSRRRFFTGFINVLAGLIALPLVWPVIRFVMKPMYAPYDNRWWKIGNVGRITAEDVGVQFRFKKTVKDSVLVREDDKNEWVIKASPKTLERIYRHGGLTFADEKGTVFWVNSPTVPYVAFSGEMPAPRVRLQVAHASNAGTGIFVSLSLERLRRERSRVGRARPAPPRRAADQSFPDRRHRGHRHRVQGRQEGTDPDRVSGLDEANLEQEAGR